MRLEIVLFFIAAVWIYHIYTDGKVWKLLANYKKYYQMGGVVLGFFIICWLMRANPKGTQEMLLSTNEYIKYLPVDRNVKSMLDPVLRNFSASSSQTPLTESVPLFGGTTTMEKMSSGSGSGGAGDGGGGATKRSVSESKKKYVASKQAWKCRECQEILPATFEVDHIKRLQYGGSNEIDNLQALCPNCHREKTMKETMGGMQSTSLDHAGL
jgi:5-methylcytosine-specific restriction protein A